MLFIGIILFGMLVGAAAQLILGRGGSGINWPLAFGTASRARSSVGCLPACSRVTGSTCGRAASSAPSSARSS
jgi:hypothetical protein